MINLDEQTKDIIKHCASQKVPQEAGGLLLEMGGKILVFNCDNASPEPLNHFLVSDEDQTEARKLGKIVAYFHSHPKDNHGLSQADIAISENLKLDSIVYCVDQDKFYQYSPVGYEFPYEGRQRFFGVLDCLTLVMDYYKRELNIEIPYISHPIFKSNNYEWIKTIEPQEFLKIGMSFLEENGFQLINIKDLKKHDLVVIQLEGYRFPTHFGIYLNDNRFLHQLTEKSEISIYGKYWRKRTILTYRHKILF